jgi:hypothetical protein
MLVEILLHCAEQLGLLDLLPNFNCQAQALTDGIVASIPFHLARDPGEFLHTVLSGVDSVISVGRPVGGLLLLHPLYVATRSSILPLALRNYLSECLEWIGQHMGIGQATLLSKASSIP